MTTTIFDRDHLPSQQQRDAVADFLALHLGRYGDPRHQITQAMDHALANRPGPGGFIGIVSDGDMLAGAVVVNRTGMGGYIPENQLVYIAIHEQLRGRGIGRSLMQAVVAHAQGAIALHVEADNPARHLYESLGFTNKYLEMRLERKEAP